MTNEYIPTPFKDEIFLRKDDDLTDKVWDEDALRLWENEENNGMPWLGRQNHTPQFRTEQRAHIEKSDG